MPQLKYHFLNESQLLIPHPLLFVSPFLAWEILFESPGSILFRTHIAIWDYLAHLFVYLFKVYIPCLEWKFCEGKDPVYIVHLWDSDTKSLLHLVHGECSVIFCWIYESG